MKLALLFSAALSWLFLHGALGWDAPDFCLGYECPEYKLVQETKEFEVRTYNASRWITTDVIGDQVVPGFQRLHDYCKENSVTLKTWPALVSVVEVAEEEEQFSVSYFIPPGTELPSLPPSIREETKPAGTVYVRVFRVFTVLLFRKVVQDEVKLLVAALQHAGKTFQVGRYTGAGYQNPFDIFHHHNEVWVYAR